MITPNLPSKTRLYARGLVRIYSLYPASAVQNLRVFSRSCSRCIIGHERTSARNWHHLVPKGFSAKWLKSSWRSGNVVLTVTNWFIALQWSFTDYHLSLFSLFTHLCTLEQFCSRALQQKRDRRESCTFSFFVQIWLFFSFFHLFFLSVHLSLSPSLFRFFNPFLDDFSSFSDTSPSAARDRHVLFFVSSQLSPSSLTFTLQPQYLPLTSLLSFPSLSAAWIKVKLWWPASWTDRLKRPFNRKVNSRFNSGSGPWPRVPVLDLTSPSLENNQISQMHVLGEVWAVLGTLLSHLYSKENYWLQLGHLTVTKSWGEILSFCSLFHNC